MLEPFLVLFSPHWSVALSTIDLQTSKIVHRLVNFCWMVCDNSRWSCLLFLSVLWYRALAATAGLGFLLKDMDVPMVTTHIIYSDNLSALHLTVNPAFHARSKHIELDFHYVRERVARKLVQTEFVPSTDQVADIFTKPLSTDLFQKFASKLNLLTKLGFRGGYQE